MVTLIRHRETTAVPLALRNIEDNLCFTAKDVWAWFVLPTQPWAFRSDAQREHLMVGAGEALTWMAGYRMHLRVTTQPYPAASWAQQLHSLTPDPLPGWADHLEGTQVHLRHQTMAEKKVFLGVRVSTRRPSHRALGKIWHHPGYIEHARLLPQVERITESVSLPGLDGRPATADETEWLLRRSVGIGLAAPVLTSPVEGAWELDDLHSLTDQVDYSVDPLGRTVRVIGRDGAVQRNVAVLSVGRLEEFDGPDPERAPWLSHTDRLFPVEWSVRFEILSGGQARQQIQRKLLVVRDMQRHYREHGLDEPLVLDRQADQARQVEDQMSRGSEVSAARLHGWFRLAVSGANEEECLERVRKVTASYRGRQVSIEHPRGQFRLLREFVPGEPLSTVAYRRRLPVLYFTAGMPAVSSQVGDRRGPYVGYTIGSSRRAVMFDTHYATEVKEASGLVPVVGGLGAGKSVLLGQIIYGAVRRGIPSVVLDPSGPLARLTDLPELRDNAEHLDLTTAAQGTLNPFGVVAQPRREAFTSSDQGLDDYNEAKVLAAQDRRLLARDIIKMLLPPSLDRISATSLVVSDAVRATRGDPDSSLWDVVRNLERNDDPHGKVVANYLRDMSELPLARLLFPAQSPGAARPGSMLTVLTMPGLVLPPRSVARDHWSTSEQLAVPLLHLAAWYATRAIYGREMQARKLVALDEVHFLGEWSAGRALFTRLGRDSRKWNTCVLAASQNPSDVLGMDVANFISSAFVGKTEDDEAARDGLRMLRVATGVGYEASLANLSRSSASREFVMRDADGNVDVVRVDLTANPALLEALNTTARPVPVVSVA